MGRRALRTILIAAALAAFAVGCGGEDGPSAAERAAERAEARELSACMAALREKRERDERGAPYAEDCYGEIKTADGRRYSEAQKARQLEGKSDWVHTCVADFTSRLMRFDIALSQCQGFEAYG